MNKMGRMGRMGVMGAVLLALALPSRAWECTLGEEVP